jgi:hypothetical protein
MLRGVLKQGGEQASLYQQSLVTGNAHVFPDEDDEEEEGEDEVRLGRLPCLDGFRV